MAVTGKRQSVTVSLPVDTIRKPKILAARQSLSISGMLAEQIEMLVGTEDAYQRAKRSAFSLMDKGFGLGGGISVGRDELHER